MKWQSNSVIRSQNFESTLGSGMLHGACQAKESTSGLIAAILLKSPTCLIGATPPKKSLIYMGVSKLVTVKARLNGATKAATKCKMCCANTTSWSHCNFFSFDSRKMYR